MPMYTEEDFEDHIEAQPESVRLPVTTTWPPIIEISA